MGFVSCVATIQCTCILLQTAGHPIIFYYTVTHQPVFLCQCVRIYCPLRKTMEKCRESVRMMVSHWYSRCEVLKLPRRPPTAGCWCLSHQWRSDDCYRAGRQRWSRDCCARRTRGSEPEGKSQERKKY